MRWGEAWQVFRIFLRLGLTSFGGPIAHLGYFRTEFVARRRWLGEADYAELVALCQFLPGPTSSQVGMAIGLRRAGWAGCLAAWTGFTLPSALALMGFALGLAHYPQAGGSGWMHGLKIAAVAVVAHAVWGMARTLCPDLARRAIAAGAALLVLALPATAGQLAAMAAAALAGAWLCEPAPAAASAKQAYGISRHAARMAMLALGALLVGLPLWSAWHGGALASLAAGIARAGALVFGGGHVVLPLLESATVATGLVSETVFLAGYGAAQAVPGPLFTFAAYLGTAAATPWQGWPGGLLALAAIFAPGLLLLAAALPYWERIRAHAAARSALAGVNAGVVGLLAAALCTPLAPSAILSWTDAVLALAAFLLLQFGKAPPLAVVAACALAGGLLGMG